MGMITSSNKSELKKVIDINRTIFFVGAGISINEPTGLPSGKELTNYYLDLAIGKNAADRLRHIWTDVSSIINKHEDDFQLRLEFIISQINKVDKEFNRTPLIGGLKKFEDAKYNENHRIIAELAQKGGIVVTPNFDSCIQKASHVPFKVHYNMGFPVAYNSNSQIYYFHGNANMYNDLEYELGATIDKIKEGLTIAFKEKLIEYFEIGYSIVFLGYSASDYFDIMPFFKELPSEKYNGGAIFFCHGEGEISETFLERINTCLNPFSEKCIRSGNTTEFLKQILGEEIIGPEGVSRQDWWKENFAEIMSQYNDNEKMLFEATNLIRLSDQLGISIDKLTEKYMEYANICVEGLLNREELEDYLISLPDKEMSIIPAVIRIYNENYVKKIRKRYPSYVANFNKLKEKIEPIYRGWYSPLKAKDMFSFESFCYEIESGKCDVQNYNSAKYYAANSFTNMFLEEKKVGINKCDVERLHKCIGKMLQLPYYRHIYISYFIEEMMMKELLCARINLKYVNENNIKSMLELSFEICSFLHVYRVFWNNCKIAIMLFKHSKKVKFLYYLVKNYIIARRISKKIGMKHDLFTQIIKKYFKYGNCDKLE